MCYFLGLLPVTCRGGYLFISVLQSSGRPASPRSYYFCRFSYCSNFSDQKTSGIFFVFEGIITYFFEDNMSSTSMFLIYVYFLVLWCVYVWCVWVLEGVCHGVSVEIWGQLWGVGSPPTVGSEGWNEVVRNFGQGLCLLTHPFHSYFHLNFLLLSLNINFFGIFKMFKWSPPPFKAYHLLKILCALVWGCHLP